MTRFHLMTTLLLAAGILGCEPPEMENQPQERDQPGIDMDARDQEPGVGVTTERPEATPDTDIDTDFDTDTDPQFRTPSPTREFEIPTQSPSTAPPTRTQPGTQSDDTTVPEVDLDAPQTDEAQGATSPQPGDVEVPEVDLDAPASGGGTVTEEEGDVTLPEINPES